MRQAGPSRYAEANLRLGQTALDLLAWDRYRTLERLDHPESVEVERLIERGSACHRRLLTAVHEGRDAGSLTQTDEWLVESRSEWSTRPTMTEKGSFLRGPRLRLTEEDLARLDRGQPACSFSAEPPKVDAEAEGGLVEKFERLGGLRQEGLLTEEEFRAAKAKLLR